MVLKILILIASVRKTSTLTGDGYDKNLSKLYFNFTNYILLCVTPVQLIKQVDTLKML